MRAHLGIPCTINSPPLILNKVKMRRNYFIRLCMAASAITLFPFDARAKKRIGKGLFVQSGKDRFGKPFAHFGTDNLFNKVSSSDSDGDLYIIDTTRTAPGGPPLHIHYDQDEWWYVITGEFLIQVGDETFHAKPGDSVFGPRRIPHSFAKIGEGEGKVIILFQPAGKMEDFFRASSEGKLAKMTDAQKNEFRKQHGFEQVGPPIAIPEK
jgi:mannose-6-phosphate isomerase-like protein (cupin superfamily)